MALVDLVMPKMSGPEFLARLRQFDPALARRSVVFTGASLEDAAAGFPAGERPAILRKSGDLEQLTALLDTVRDAQAT
jgi:CheY-like chemotaxis protein